MRRVTKKKVLVCGATGFIGRNAVEAFADRDDFQVIAVHHRKPALQIDNVEWLEADLTNPDDVARVVSGIDVIVQAAAATSGSADIVNRPHIHVTDNAVMNSLLFRAAHDHGVGQVVFFSCTIMLQSAPEPQSEDDYDESAGIHPAYFAAGSTKLYLEKMCDFFSRLGTTRYSVLRHSNIYGPHDNFDLQHSHVFGATVTKVMTSDDGRIVVWGKGREGRDLLYVADLVDLVGRCIDRQATPCEIFNAGIGEAVTVTDLARRIITASGRDLKIEYDPDGPNIDTTLCLDCAKAERLLGWRAETTLNDGISKTIAWWKEQNGRP